MANPTLCFCASSMGALLASQGYLVRLSTWAQHGTRLCIGARSLQVGEPWCSLVRHGKPQIARMCMYVSAASVPMLLSACCQPGDLPVYCTNRCSGISQGGCSMPTLT